MTIIRRLSTTNKNSLDDLEKQGIIKSVLLPER